MNDTLSAAPLSFSWSYTLDGKRVAGEDVSLKVEPGFGQEYLLKLQELYDLNQTAIGQAAVGAGP